MNERERKREREKNNFYSEKKTKISELSSTHVNQFQQGIAKLPFEKKK